MFRNQMIAAFGSSYRTAGLCRSCRRLRSFDPAFLYPNTNRLGLPTTLTYAATHRFWFPVDFMGRGFVFILLLIALPAAAQIYKYTDADGNTAYSNQPPDGVRAQPVELPPLNSVETQLPGKPAPATEDHEQSRSAYEVLELTGLPTREALRANNGTFTVNVLIKPRLQGPHLLRLLLDEQPYGQPGNVPILQLVNIDRGLHSLAVQVIDGDTVIQQSPTVTFTVQRVHKP
ncbi:hypothetical protein PS918_03911 [Pseudomonas fluorescens]|uniref:DUF4124 domain-containing protein n=2 Tax=Pseudomonas fluorescens TaxID=294 RepID=A0A5E7TJA4_PSEFL|nr:hypothetical protein PS918_03911 [Pseudomonas fluorescens]